MSLSSVWDSIIKALVIILLIEWGYCSKGSSNFGKCH